MPIANRNVVMKRLAFLVFMFCKLPAWPAKRYLTSTQLLNWPQRSISFPM